MVFCLPERAEGWFFEGSTCTGKIHGALFCADEDEFTGDEPR